MVSAQEMNSNISHACIYIMPGLTQKGKIWCMGEEQKKICMSVRRGKRITVTVRADEKPDTVWILRSICT